MSNATSFGRQAATYAMSRPNYPPKLYDWIVSNSPNTERVWDVGTGSGQAAIALSERFDQVHATDISAEQIAAAPTRENISYHVARAQKSGLPDRSLDAITVATALHWFADADFWSEVQRVAKPDALFCAWVYQLPKTTKDVHQDFLDPVYDIVDAYWADGNRLCMAGYTAENLKCPFPTIDTPAFDAGAVWTAEQLANFALTWSAHLRAREDGHAEVLENLQNNFLENYAGQSFPVSLPLSLLAAPIN